MRKLTKRVETLERTAPALRNERNHLLEAALDRPNGDWEALMSSFFADAIGRPLSEREVTARQQYEHRVAFECQAAGWPALNIQWDMELFRFLWAHGQKNLVELNILLLSDALQARALSIPLTDYGRALVEHFDSNLHAFLEAIGGASPIFHREAEFGGKQ